MNKTHRGIKYRIYPSLEQQVLIAKTFGCSRFVYNKMLGFSKDAYERGKKLTSRNKFNYCLTELKKEFPWLSEVDATALTSANDALADAFANFFGKRAGFPNFHKKKTRGSYTGCSWWTNNRDVLKYGYSMFNINYNKYLKEFIIENPPNFK